MEPNEEYHMESPRVRIPAIASIVLFMGLFLFVAAISQLVVVLVMEIPATGSYTFAQHFALQFCSLLATVFPAWLMLRTLDYRPFSDLGLNLRGRGMDILWGLLAVMAMYAIGFGISLGTSLVEVVGISWNADDLAMSFLFYIMVAFTEEIMMRGYILGRLLRTRLNKFVSLGISSLLFSLMHAFNPNVAFLPLFNILLAGFFLGASYLYTRNLWFPISLHLFWNWIQGPVLGYSVSGQQIGNSLLTLRLPENNLLNGGEFGFEGSLLCTILLILATGLIIFYYERKKQV